ncbi:hypothetical protein FHS07_002108 [Microbacterium proteolyticum]|uniref:Uncharacterized protein n=1 Tax=Microbacterium proteolyticum TaxID=1572644 RepID=A0A7W5GGM5_9MICO|nr:hypothetical protein [Microbacterium proteolyticum]MBB3158412.1 hypothetical protein [Microbacterium proteolyticum]
MTTLTTPMPTLALTTGDRALLALSRALARAVDTRMQARAMRVSRDHARRAARDDGRSPLAEAEFTLRVR